MYFPELTPYEYGGVEPSPFVVNVGWLSIEQPFATGSCSTEFMSELARLVENPENLYRGVHLCEFCPAPTTFLSERGLPVFSPAPGTAGNGEVRVQGEDGMVYVAPVLVLHYIKVHGYRPPDVFINAVLRARRAAK
jgi:hypothetical protein